MFHGMWINKNSTIKFPHCYARQIMNLIAKGIIWGRYLPKGEYDVAWGSYGGTVVQYQVGINDCDMIDQYLMIEKNWHVLRGTYDPTLQMNIYDALNIEMQNPDFVIDIYYKLILPRTDNWVNGRRYLNNGNDAYVNCNIFSNYGFTPSFEHHSISGLYCGAFINNPSSPFTLPSDATLKDGYTTTQFPAGCDFDDAQPPFIWTDDFEHVDSFSGGPFITVSGEDPVHRCMLQSLNINNQGIFSAIIDPSVVGLGIPFNSVVVGRKPVLLDLFNGFIGTPAKQFMRGVLYCCLGVHKIV